MTVYSAGARGFATARGLVRTDRAARYRDQLTAHLGHMHGTEPRHADATSMPSVKQLTHGAEATVVVFDVGQLDLVADGDCLRLVVTAEDDVMLSRLQALLATRVETIGRRDRLTVQWEEASS